MKNEKLELSIEFLKFEFPTTRKDVFNHEDTGETRKKVVLTQRI